MSRGVSQNRIIEVTGPATIVLPVAKGTHVHGLGTPAHWAITNGGVIPECFEVFNVFHDVILPPIFILSSGAFLLGSIRAGLGALLSGFHPTTKIVYHGFIESQAGSRIFSEGD